MSDDDQRRLGRKGSAIGFGGRLQQAGAFLLAGIV